MVWRSRRGIFIDMVEVALHESLRCSTFRTQLFAGWQLVGNVDILDLTLHPCPAPEQQTEHSEQQVL